MSLMSAPAGQEWGSFLAPGGTLHDVTDLAREMQVKIHSGIRARFDVFRGSNRIFDQIITRIEQTDLQCEDQCSAKHYSDVFDIVRSQYGRMNRLVEVGVYLGGASTVLAGCIGPLDAGLDLVDTNPAYLRFAHERIRRTFPEAIGRVRMFHGDLPTYVHRVIVPDESCALLIHHDGAHDFPQVVRDLASLYFVRDRVRGLMIQDTHLRGRIGYCNFVDAAVFAVFGYDARYLPLGRVYPPGDPALEPNRWQGNYFLPDAPEGMFLPFESNVFRYPHPSMTLEEFLPNAA